jgi:precorrin-6B C5,15-methyltransferase / cobalt-precorrin-6B C5,C15-methyltransferase
MPDGRPIVVVGIGADGWSGLGEAARSAISSADVVLGSSRQLDLIPFSGVAWRSPLSSALPRLLSEYEGKSICVLASGDPTYYGIGTTLVRLLGVDAVRVIPHPSSISLACAHLGWAQETVAVVSLVGRPLELLYPQLQPGRRVLVLSSDGSTPSQVAKALTERGYGDSLLTVLQQLGSSFERTVAAVARSWPDGDVDPLNVVAVECRISSGVTLLPLVPGLPNDVYENDGQLSKREVRAVALSRLAPLPGQLLWDVGGGAGSVAIEWLRTHPSCRAITIESDSDRAARIARNAAELGVPGLQIVEGQAPAALADLEQPDAIFVGGGGADAGVLHTCWQALRPGGRLVASAVTIETEKVLADWYARVGGELVRIAVQHASPLGGMTGWRPAMPVTLWTVVSS